MNTLYLGSKSPSRRMLLSEAKIPYVIVEQDADKSVCDWDQSLQKVVESIAAYKMEHLILPAGSKNGQICFVLTADTLSEDFNGMISGKPVDYDDAIKKLKAARNGMRTGTAFCLDRKVWQQGKWLTEKRIAHFADAQYEFNVPDDWIERYIENSDSLQVTQAIAIEGYGAQFVRMVHGSYTSIVGLPMYEVRIALEKLGFF